MSNVNARYMSWRHILWLSFVGPMACSHAMLAFAQTQTLDEPTERAFTRIEATLDIIQSLTADGYYLPMERKQFENIVSSLRSDIPDSVRRRAAIDLATYSAKLEGHQLVDGQGSLVVTSDAEVETEIALGDLDLSIQQPQWRSRRDEAKLGIANTGERVLLVPQSDTCDFQWSRRVPRILPARSSRLICAIHCSINSRSQLPTVSIWCRIEALVG